MLNTLKEWVIISPSDDFWLWSTGLVVAAITGFFFAFHVTHKKRIIEDTPTSKIRSAAQGYIELVGHGYLMDGQPIASPLTGKSCTWYEYRVEERRQSGKRTEWKTIRKGISDELFLIKDETGECVIDPEGANVTVSDSRVWYGHSSSPSANPGSVKASAMGRFTRSLIGSVNKYRYTEKLLHSGESLYAIGFYKTVGGSGAKLDVNEDVRELIREWKTDTEKLMKQFDTDKDGELDLQEWQKVREAAYKKVMEKHDEQKLLPPVHLMGKTNDRRRPYILSALAQDDLTKKLHIYSLLSIGVFLIAGSLVTWMISIRLAS